MACYQYKDLGRYMAMKQMKPFLMIVPLKSWWNRST